MGDFYEIPGGLTWVKANLKVIIGNEDLAKIMNFGDLWRSRGHKPLVHVISPAMDNGKMWEQHKDPSGLLDNIPAHIDMFIVDYYNLENPEVPSSWAEMTSPPKWLLWEYKAGKVRFNGTKQQFVSTFKVDPVSTPTTPTGGGGAAGESPTGGGIIHIVCPHCGKLIV
jgi:hypothetical protein